MKLHHFLVFAAMMMLFSCKVSTEKGKEKLDDAVTNMSNQIEMMKDTEMRNAVEGLFGLGSTPDFSKDNFSATPQNIQKIIGVGYAMKETFVNKYSFFSTQKIGDEQFSLTQHAGTYTWNKTTEDWDFQSTPTDKVVVLFPSKNSSSNDCRFEWSKYQEVKSTDGFYLPTVIYAELFKDDKTIAVVDVEVEYNLATEIPKMVKFYLELTPVKFKLDYTFENKIAKFSASVKKGSKKINEIDAEITFTNEEMYDVVSGSGTYKMYDVEKSRLILKIVFEFEDGFDKDCASFNELASIKLYTSSNRLIGEIQCDDNDECGMIIVFNDGQTKDVCYYFDKMEREIENALDDF